MSNLSDLLPAGGGGLTAEFVASGTLPNGTPVILNNDGTVTAVAEISVSGIVIPETANPVNFSASGSSYMTSQFSPSTANVFVVAYRDGATGYGNSIVGTVSGTSISFGTPSLFHSGLSFIISIAFDDSNPSKFVIAYSDAANSNYGTAVIGTISGTSLSYGTAVVFNSGATSQDIQADYIASNKFAVAYQDGGNSNYGTAIVGTVSGTSISFGSEYVFSAVNITTRISLKKDPNATDIFVVAYADNVSNVAKAVVGTVSGNSISYGSATTYESSFVNWCGVSFDPSTANKFAIMFGTGSTLEAIIGTRSGTSISFGSAATVQNNYVTNPAVAYDLNTANRFVIAYRNNGNSNYGTATVCTVSGSTITVGTSYVYNSYLSNYTAICFDSNNSGKFTVSFYNGNGPAGSTILGNLEGSIVGTNLTSTNFVGIPDKAYASGATATVSLQGGVSLNQTSLTIDTAYYVQENGTLGTAADTISVKAGVALSATSLHLDNGTIPAQTGNSGKNLTTDGTTTSWASPQSAKVWFRYNPSAGTVQASYNITSITDTATGTTDVTIATDFSSANYAIVGTCEDTKFVSVAGSGAPAPAAGTFRVFTKDTNGTAADPEALWVVCFGDQS